MAAALRAWAEGRRGSMPAITWSEEPAPLGTAGGLKWVEPHIRGERFLVVNGDSLLPGLDFSALFRLGVDPACAAAIAVARMERTSRYGTVEFDARGRVTAFREKAERSEGWVNGGIYLLRRGLLAEIARDKPVSIESDLFPALAARGDLYACPVNGPLLDMGTPEGLQGTERFLADAAPDLAPR
jgi:NDP-sugar pyrophosphorylase family protein